jgi:hypothetical protein
MIQQTDQLLKIHPPNDLGLPPPDSKMKPYPFENMNGDAEQDYPNQINWRGLVEVAAVGAVSVAVFALTYLQ